MFILYPSKAASALLMFVFICGAHMNSFANPITLKRAKEIASQYIKVRSGGNLAKKVMGMATSDIPYSIYEGADGRGFVVVSGDDALGEVLAYSKEGRIGTCSSSPASLFLDGYAKDYAAYCRGQICKGDESHKPSRSVA